MNYYRNIFRSIKVQLICYICLLTTVPLLFVCIVEYYSSKSAIEQRVIEQLTSIADLKKSELNSWLEERLTDTSVIVRNKVLAAAATSLLQQRRRCESVYQLMNSETARINYNRSWKIFMYSNSFINTITLFPLLMAQTERWSYLPIRISWVRP